jgi:hypothetical protein
MIDFDRIIDAGPFGKKNVPGIDVFPAWRGEGKGKWDDSTCDKNVTHVRILERFR